jgi:hypothetical protein
MKPFTVFRGTLSTRRSIIAGSAILLLIGLTMVLVPKGIDPEAPRFVRGLPQPLGPLTSVDYGWGELVPFAGGKVWLWTFAGTNRHCFWYDLDRRVVIGELMNAGPVFCNPKETKLLCEGHASLKSSLKQRLFALAEKFVRGKVPLPKINREDAYWVLDLRDNSVRRVGELSQIIGTGSHWRPSPGFRYGCNVPNNTEEGTAFFLCDVETGAFEKIRFPGVVQGWWDESQLLVRDPANNFVLFDVVTRKTNTLFSATFLQDTLHRLNLTNYPGQIRAINDWNGHGYDYYFASQTASYRAGQSFLFKTSHADPTLKLLYPNFKFEHLGRLDASATHYLYNGEPGLPGRGGNGAVLLRDLTNDSTTTLVPPDNSGWYALPRFYRDEVIYRRNRVLWRMNLDGSNNAPLFPDTSH